LAIPEVKGLLLHLQKRALSEKRVARIVHEVSWLPCALRIRLGMARHLVLRTSRRDHHSYFVKFMELNHIHAFTAAMQRKDLEAMLTHMTDDIILKTPLVDEPLKARQQ
jgi:hypothetical protein